MNLGSKRKVRIAITKAGEVSIRPLPDVMSFFGALKNNVPYDPDEKRKARAAIGHRGARKQ